MAEEVKLPQLGESVTEGTITAWLVKEGEQVEEDQPLFEISTDKIDTEVPSPASGVLSEIRAQVDDTIEVGEVVALIESDGAAPAEEAEAEPEAEEEEAEAETAEAETEEAETEARPRPRRRNPRSPPPRRRNPRSPPPRRRRPPPRPARATAS